MLTASWVHGVEILDDGKHFKRHLFMHDIIDENCAVQGNLFRVTNPRVLPNLFHRMGGWAVAVGGCISTKEKKGLSKANHEKHEN